MLTKMKIAIVLCGSLLCGVAAAQPAAGSGAPDRAAWKAQRFAKRQEKLQRFDTNRDGKLDRTERTTMHETKVVERFKTLDADNNGVITFAEFKAGKQMHKRHARGGKRGMRGGFHGQGAQ
jgi:hypothetical protein